MKYIQTWRSAVSRSFLCISYYEKNQVCLSILSFLESHRVTSHPVFGLCSVHLSVGLVKKVDWDVLFWKKHYSFGAAFTLTQMSYTNRAIRVCYNQTTSAKCTCICGWRKMYFLAINLLIVWLTWRYLSMRNEWTFTVLSQKRLQHSHFSW